MFKKRIGLFLIISIFTLSLFAVFGIAKDCGGILGEPGYIDCACGDRVIRDTTLSKQLSCGNIGLIISADHDFLVLDCAGYTISGSTGSGIHMFGVTNAKVKDCVIDGFDVGIYLSTSSQNTLSENILSENNNGINLVVHSKKNKIEDNFLCGNLGSDIFVAETSTGNSGSGNSLTTFNSFYSWPSIPTQYSCCTDSDEDNYCFETNVDPDLFSGGDCNDLDPERYPGAEEICDGKDNDCDGTIDGPDICNVETDCGKPGNSCDVGETCQAGDCVCPDKDGDTKNEALCGGEDCDDDTSDDIPELNCPQAPGVCDSSTSECAICINEDAEEICDSVDNNCDGKVNEDLIGTILSQESCPNGELPADGAVGLWWNTCTIKGSQYHSGKCNPLCTDVDQDSYGAPETNLILCSGSTELVDCNDNEKDINPVAEEICDNKDNNCDGKIDEELGTTTCGLGICEHTLNNCAAGKEQVCDPFEGAVEEVCDALDNNCDGEIDEGWICDSDNDGVPDESESPSCVGVGTEGNVMSNGCLKGDMSAKGCVNSQDVAQFLAAYAKNYDVAGTCQNQDYSDLDGDFSGDKCVNSQDVAQFLAAYAENYDYAGTCQEAN